MSVTFDNSRNDYFIKQIKAKGLTLNQIGTFAFRYHTPTKPYMTDEEFHIHSQKFSGFLHESFGFATAAEARNAYLEDFINFRHESIRRSIENSRSSNQFNHIVSGFNPMNRISAAPGMVPFNNNIFQNLANTLAQEKTTNYRFHTVNNGAFSNEEAFELRLHVLHAQFNEAVHSIADIFAEMVRGLETMNRRPHTPLSADQAHDAVVRIGSIIRDHIWSGGSAENINSTLENANALNLLNQLNTIGNSFHRSF